MVEKLNPNVLSPEDTTDTVSWYNNLMPVVPKDGDTQYLIVSGEKVEMSSLNEADWLILRALYPQGPQELY